MFLVDDKEIFSYEQPKCVEARLTSFEEIAQRIIKVNPAFKLYSGYKLCDYRPLYGTIFQSECEGYDYWGYCDIDTLMGDITAWLEGINYQKYDRIGRAGHFTIYRNTAKVNNLWKEKIPGTVDWEYIFGTSYPCNFDEIVTNAICKRLGIAFYESNNEANIEPFESLHLKTFEHKTSVEPLCQLFVWIRGHTYIYQRKNGKIERREVAYIHYQNRKNLPTHGMLGDSFIVTHEGFYPFDETKIETLMDEFGRNDTEAERKAFRQVQYAAWRKSRKRRLLFELRTLGLVKTLKNIKMRLKTTSHSTILMKV